MLSTIGASKPCRICINPVGIGVCSRSCSDSSYKLETCVAQIIDVETVSSIYSKLGRRTRWKRIGWGYIPSCISNVTPTTRIRKWEKGLGSRSSVGQNLVHRVKKVIWVGQGHVEVLTGNVTEVPFPGQSTIWVEYRRNIWIIRASRE